MQATGGSPWTVSMGLGMHKGPMIFSGGSNPALARDVCACLRVEPGQAFMGRFSDGEVRVEIYENVRGMNTFALQSTSPPVNENLMELLILIDALKRASAKSINAVIPYYGYGRQDLKDKPRVALSARMVADLVTVAGASRLMSIDLHADQIQGFFNIPVDHLPGAEVFLAHLKKELRGDEVILAPDAAGVARARAFASRLNVDLAIMDFRGVEYLSSARIVGKVRDRRVIVVDDLVDTGKTLRRAAESAVAQGAAVVDACCVHPILSGNAIDTVESSPLRTLMVSDTVSLSEQASRCGKILVVSIAPLLAEAIKRVDREESVSSLVVAM